MNGSLFKRAIWLLMSLVYFMLFGKKIIEQVSFPYETGELNTDSLIHLNSLLLKETKKKELVLEKLNSDPSTLFLETTRTLKVNDITLLYAGNQGGFDMQQKFNLKSDSRIENYVLVYEASYITSLQVINSLENREEMRRIKSLTIEPSDRGLLYTRIEIAND